MYIYIYIYIMYMYYASPIQQSAKDATGERYRADAATCHVIPENWLQAPQSSSVGPRMEDEVIRITAGLRLGVPLYNPHTCHSCGRQVNELATHGLSCVRSQGRHSQHSTLNDLIHKI